MKTIGFFAQAAIACGLLLTAGAVWANQAGNQSDLQKASVLDHMAVKNEKGQDLGRVVDLMINVRDGRVAYAAIGYGGTVGIGEKYFAVPLDMLSVTTSPNHPQEQTLVLNIAKEQFDSQPGFKTNNWPTRPDEQLFKGVHVAVGGVHVNVAIRGDREGEAHLRRATALTGMAVKDNHGEALGKVRDLMIDITKGQVVYAAVGHGGTLGIGEKLFAVPWAMIDVKSTTGSLSDEACFVNVDKSALDNHPGFNKDAWPTKGNQALFEAK